MSFSPPLSLFYVFMSCSITVCRHILFSFKCFLRQETVGTGGKMTFEEVAHAAIPYSNSLTYSSRRHCLVLLVWGNEMLCNLPSPRKNRMFLATLVLSFLSKVDCSVLRACDLQNSGFSSSTIGKPANQTGAGPKILLLLLLALLYIVAFVKRVKPHFGWKDWYRQRQGRSCRKNQNHIQYLTTFWTNSKNALDRFRESKSVSLRHHEFKKPSRLLLVRASGTLSRFTGVFVCTSACHTSFTCPLIYYSSSLWAVTCSRIFLFFLTQ